ncbi:MAG: phosphate signaling complex protein PhoU [Anaerolineae bacterium]|nr:phosphate signaling complex protein PhoU [Anaerolineae bacterium]
MTRENLSRQIHHIQDEILLLGSMVEQAMLSAIDCLKRRDIKTAQEVYDGDHLINEKRFAIENAILILFATQQPMAHDLRILAAMLEINTELERMGDYAKGVAKVVIKLGDTQLDIPIKELNRMAEMAVGMLHRALSAFISENVNQSTLIPREDDEVDRLYNTVYHDLVNKMIDKPELIDYTNLLMWVAHNLERMADRVTNICERTIFIGTGELMEISSSDDEDAE